MSHGLDIAALPQEYETKTPGEVVLRAAHTCAPDIEGSTSFQTQGMPGLHRVTRVMPDARLHFLDTGYHSWDTLTFRERVQCDLFNRKHPSEARGQLVDGLEGLR